ncbi:MAG: D-alanyl-D-alanine carboxypeptidase [Hyphomonadaceae bacterium]|nr:D-alanyl-D-alanine carboxypeptidase [Hyphomonadaceae bacterium]
MRIARWISRTAAALAAAAFAFGGVSHAQGGFSTTATSAIIMDAGTGITLFCENCREPMPPASMSKLMTILLVAEAIEAGRINENTRFRVSENAWRHGAMSDGSHMFLAINSEVRVGDLLRGLSIVSANDACIVLAEGLAGGEAQFVDQMNRRAVELGLTTARFRNATGLPDPDHVISPYDLARLTRMIITRFPAIYRLDAERSFTYNNRTQENRNPLLGLFPGADGVKTGHTNASGYGMVGSAVLNGQRRIIVFNGMPSMAARRSEAERMMRAAFYDFRVTAMYPENATVGEAEVWLGSKKTVPLVTKNAIAIGMANAARGGARAAIVYQGPVPAPISEGQEIAKLVVEGPAFPRREFPLYAGRRVGRANWFARAWTGLGSLGK